MGRLGAEAVAAGLCFALLIPGLAVAQAPAPVKIGMLVPLTGVFTRNGREAVDGARLYLDEIGWKYPGWAEFKGKMTDCGKVLGR